MSTAEPSGRAAPIELDPHDWQLLHLLAEDAGVSSAWLAEQSGLGEVEVSKRVVRLRQSGVIKGIHARVDPQALGMPLTAFFMIRVAQTAEAFEAIDRMIRDIDRVSFRRVRPRCVDFIRSLFCIRFCPTHARDARTLARQPQGDRMTDSPPRSCHDSNLIFKSHNFLS